MTEVMAARGRYKDLFEKKHGIRLGFMGFFVKAAALAARDVPSVNAYIEGDEIVYHDYLDVSVAVSAPNGLVVPVIRNAHAMSFAEIEKTIADFGKRAKAGTLTMDDMKGGTFTISNGGVFGSLCRRRSSTRPSRRCSACTASRNARWCATDRSSPGR
jgi:2-oxoglutarate dehydrogenase E2 component (dihydrolipoamide succinyltransferase)